MTDICADEWKTVFLPNIIEKHCLLLKKQEHFSRKIILDSRGITLWCLQNVLADLKNRRKFSGVENFAT